jgi:hypothetical protein
MITKALVLTAVLTLAQAHPPANVSGTWEWQGTAGWQRIILTLKSDGSLLTGVLRMGPGTHEPATPADFWEYFFDPVDFRISNGTVSGNEIGFEHAVLKAPVSTQGGLVFSGPTNVAPSGRSIADTKFVYKGVVQADTLVMTREVVSDKKDPWSLGAHKVEFVLKRVK